MKIEDNDFNKEFYSTQFKIRDYFRQKSKKIIAQSNELLSDHPTEKGTHREILIQNYLEEIIPKRYGIGTGIIYGRSDTKSKQTDIVIWDAINYPILKSLGHNTFFAETVKIAIEVKSSWSSDTFKDILLKTQAVKSVVSSSRYSNHAQRLALLEHYIESGNNDVGFVSKKPLIGMVAIIFKGGENFDVCKFSELQKNAIDMNFPDLMLFVEIGKIFVKRFDFDEKTGFPISGTYQMYNANEDAFLFFTCELLRLISSSSVDFDTPFFLDEYLIFDNFFFENNLSYHEIPFPVEPMRSSAGGFGLY
ncbi:MAG: hypothetical protein EAZ97_05075 [Bacteroidetes bacterium]|nr:MAG: hypothetical protein EAZ97_05075 [Bacteroidota bacterium]